jgi:hypothetical protein
MKGIIQLFDGIFVDWPIKDACRNDQWNFLKLPNKKEHNAKRQMDELTHSARTGPAAHKNVPKLFRSAVILNFDGINGWSD